MLEGRPSDHCRVLGLYFKSTGLVSSVSVFTYLIGSKLEMVPYYGFILYFFLLVSEVNILL